MSQPASQPLHIPVLAQRCVELLRPAVDTGDERGQPVVIDATLGLGGHSELVLSTFPGAHVIGIDRDSHALELAESRLAPFGERFRAVHAVYDQIAEVVEQYAPDSLVKGVIMDLGVSSMQLDQAHRGFAYSQQAPLDMRMDQSEGVTAADLLSTATEEEIRRILFHYGEEKFARRIAHAIVAQRDVDPLVRSDQLVDLIREAIPAAGRRTGGNPAKRTFQALRIAVNSELDTLQRAVPAAVAALAVTGRIIVMSYHSLEDRIVKRAFAQGAKSSAPPDMPVELPEQAPYLRLLTRGAEKANDREIAENPRSKPVRLRAAEITRQSTRMLSR